MDWPLVTGLISILMALVGLGLVVFVTIKLARDVKWKQAYRSEQDGRWSFPHRLGVAGLVLMALGLLVLGLMIHLLVRGKFP
jgi:hypothetical protein